VDTIKLISRLSYPQKVKEIWASAMAVMLAALLCITWLVPQVTAQSAGEGSLQGTVTDTSGAVIPNATVTATNTATGVSSTTKSTSAGFYTISPMNPGVYVVRIAASGFKTIDQQNVVVNALQSRVYDPVMSVGEETQTVTVNAAPPVLNTADATLGLTVENSTYANLPLQMNGSQQRDPTAFATLTPGAQTGTRLPVIGGTGNYLGQLYLEGMPAQTVNQQGDNRLVSLSMSVEAVDQFQVLTSTPPAEYMGAGAMNFTMKSGGLQYHGQVSDYVRNTAFDSWSFTAKAATIKSGNLTFPPVKPVEHQNEFSASFGGVVPKTAHKVFFFVAYDKYHLRKGLSPQLYTIPTQPMINGDFTELNGNVGGGGHTGTGADNPPILYDPTSNNCVGNVCARQPFMGVKNGVATYNVIPANQISPIAKAMASFMPAPTNPNVLTNNYLGSITAGFDNHLTDWRVDYDINDKQRLSTVGAMGAVQYLNNFQSGGNPPTAYGYLPLPYVAGTYAEIFPKNYIVEHTYTITPSLVNQIKYSFTRFIQPQKNATDGVQKYSPTALGITNVPEGQASTEFPGAAFGTTAAYGTALTGWTGNSTSFTTQTVTPNTYAVTDNVQWVKGRHSMTFGVTHLWEQINSAAPVGFSPQILMNFNAFSTAKYAAGSNALSTGTAAAPSGFSFASFMLGAVAGSNSGVGVSPSLNLFPLSETGGRYQTWAPYFRDNYKITQKLTIEWGLRWDYLPPFHEVLDRWTFLNPKLTNPLTGTAGLMQFAGNYGGAGVSCGCRSPVATYWKNFGPRLGFAWELDPKTVIRSGFAMVYSQGGGVGGRGGNATGTGSLGFNMTANGPTESGVGSSAGPSYWLNSTNTSLFGPGFNYPVAPTPNVAAQTLNTGFYVNSSGTMAPAGSVNFGDFYFSGRAPEIILWNFGFERGITSDLTFAINYAANESHFIINAGTTPSGGAARGYWSNQLDPKYLAILGSVKDSTGTKPILTAAATPQNAAIVASYFGNAPIPGFFTAAGAINTSATIAQMLTHFPQYSGVTDTWGNVGNFSYQSLQVTLNQRMHKGLTYNINYTWSKNVGDDGVFRTGFDLPAGAISHGTVGFKQNRIDRSWTNISVPHNIHAYGVYQLPFGKNQIGGNSRAVRWLADAWQFSGIYTFASGTPMAITMSGLTTTASGNFPLQGQQMPDINPSFTGAARINSKFGSGPNGKTACNLGIGTNCTAVKYIDPNAFSTPQNISTVSNLPQYLIGNAGRTAAYGIRNPYYWNVDAGLRRTFPLHENIAFIFEADAINVWNHATFANPNSTWSPTSTAFGTISGMASNYNPRDWQFAGHITF
jgi:hypothetical protein